MEFIQRIRRGDQEAARLLVQSYERELRITARVTLADARLRQILDSMDVCQSIFANFFARAIAGQFELETPEHLLRLLADMVRNKVTDMHGSIVPKGGIIAASSQRTSVSWN